MALKDGAGQADGAATTSGSPAVALTGAGSSAGASTTAPPTPSLILSPGGTAAGSATTPPPTPTMLFGSAALAAGVAGGLGTGNIEGVLDGQSDGAATVFAESHPFGAGTAAGVGALAGAQGIYNAGGAGTAAGAATASATGGVTFLSTGVAAGSATLEFDFVQDSDGNIIGIATVTGSGLVVRDGKGTARGTSSLVFSFPLPMVGKTIMVGFPIVERIPPPVNAIVAPPKSFRWLQLLQRGDLPVFLSDNLGPISPFLVSFTLFQKTPTGTKLQVGPGQRTPVQGFVGEYYAVGRAGEGGQPGDWVIRWEFQRSFGGALQTEEMEFRVLDAVLAADPLDSTVRIRKFGWN